MTFDPKRKDWSILVKTRGGHISYLRELTWEEALKIYERLDPEYGGYYDKNDENCLSYSHSNDKSDAELRVVFGPEGWDADEVDWPLWPREEEENERSIQED